jgi:DNA-binding winged helix-turn-helix (wHTH) protein
MRGLFYMQVLGASLLAFSRSLDDRFPKLDRLIERKGRMGQLSYPVQVQPTEHERVEDKLAELRELLARAQELVDALSSGAASLSAKPKSITPVLEEGYRRATFGDASVQLGRQEMSLLRLLLDAKQPLSTAEIMAGLYPDGNRPGEKIVAVYISHLRKKLRAACGGRDPIQTIRGRGFQLHRDMLHGGASSEKPALVKVSSHNKRR